MRQLCETLKETDTDLVDIIQFGSSVYAPDLARDIDLLVTTRSKENEELYWDTFAGLDLGADVIVRTPGQLMGKDIAASIRLMGNLLCGDGQTFKQEFRRIINTLHIQYGYDGNYPQNDPDGAFMKWRQEFEQFIQNLEQLKPKTP